MADSATLDPNDLRLAANGRFANNAFDEALSLYSLAVEIARTRLDEQAQSQEDQHEQSSVGDTNAAAKNNMPTDTDDHPRVSDLVIHLCNRSACLHKMEMYDEACADAAEAVRLCSNISDGGGEGKNNTRIINGQLLKSLYRLARAQIAMKDYSSALNTIDTATSRCEHILQQDISGVDYDTEGKEEQVVLQLKEFTKLRSIAYKERKLADGNPNPSPPQDNTIQSIALESRTPSIREFTRPSKSSDNYHPLGEGNFSTVVICTHKITNETFALKIIEKEECKKLAKRQHPNVFNEVAMERRIFTQNRLPWHVNIIQCYHAMQDYGNLYFLMQLHQEHGDLWSKIRYKNCMVGCHSSLIRPYFYELLSAIEHCHNHGIVHRDLKPENVLLNEHGGHVILIDFGTAKDLFVTNLNGPEFVGTPDFMSPEAIREGKDSNSGGCDFTTDLWSLGVILYQLYAGALPFESQSPYLGFLKIQRGIYAGRNMGVWDDDAWDLIQKLLKVNSKERIGAGCFEWVPPTIIDGTDAKDMNSGNKRIDEEKEWVEKVENTVTISSTKQRSIGRIIEYGSGYDIVRQHPFFAKHQLLNTTNSHLKCDADISSVPQPIPSLQDLAIRATAHFIDQSSLNIDLEDLHPPGDNSSYDTLRLKPTDRRRVMHLLDRLHLLREPRIYRRFFHSKQDAQLGRIRPESRDVIGLTQMNDKMGNPRGKNPDEPHPDLQVPACKLVGTSRTRIHHITNPLFSRLINDQCNNNEEERKLYIKQLKESLRLVNRVRPNVVVACGYFDDACRKLLSKINETIPVILHDGTSYFNFWIYGAHCLAMPVKYLQGKNSDELDVTRKRDALAWFRMELEQIKTARSHGYVFLDGDARDISQEWLSYIGKRHVLGLIGTHKVPFVSGEVDASHELRFDTQFSVAKLQTNVTAGNANMDVQENEDDSSISSSDSGKSDDEHVMHIVGRLENGVRCITIGEEDLVWNGEILL